MYRVNTLLVNLIIFCDKIPQPVNKNCWLDDVLLKKKMFFERYGVRTFLSWGVFWEMFVHMIIGTDAPFAEHGCFPPQWEF